MSRSAALASWANRYSRAFPQLREVARCQLRRDWPRWQPLCRAVAVTRRLGGVQPAPCAPVGALAQPWSRPHAHERGHPTCILPLPAAVPGPRRAHPQTSRGAPSPRPSQSPGPAAAFTRTGSLRPTAAGWRGAAAWSAAGALRHLALAGRPPRSGQRYGTWDMGLCRRRAPSHGLEVSWCRRAQPAQCAQSGPAGASRTAPARSRRDARRRVVVTCCGTEVPLKGERARAHRSSCGSGCKIGWTPDLQAGTAWCDRVSAVACRAL